MEALAAGDAVLLLRRPAPWLLLGKVGMIVMIWMMILMIMMVMCKYEKFSLKILCVLVINDDDG